MPTKLEQLEQQQAQLKKQIHAEKAKQRQQQRKDDTRRKILAGAVLLAHAQQEAGFKTHLMRLLDEQLEKPNDRALFGFEPRPDSGQTEPIPTAQTPPPLPPAGQDS